LTQTSPRFESILPDDSLNPRRRFEESSARIQKNIGSGIQVSGVERDGIPLTLELAR